MAMTFSDDESDVSTDCPDIFSNDPSDDSSNSSVLDSESDSDDSDDDNYPFEDEVERPPEYYLAEAESLDVSQLRQQRYSPRTREKLDDTRCYWDR
jgi:hypothetical protein